MAVFTVCGGNPALWQWDLDRRIAVEYPACHQVHFCKEDGENALVCSVYEENGKHFANIPNVLLHSDVPLKVYAYVEDREGKRTLISETFVVNARPKPQDYIFTETETWSVEEAVADALQQAMEKGDFKGDPGPKGDPGVVKFVVVTDLPEEDSENAIYLLPGASGGEGNLFDEFVFVNGKWEKIGSAAVAVNLDEFVKRSDYATETTPGVAKWNSVYGVRVSTDGTLRTYPAQEKDIDGKTSTYRPIVPNNLDYALKKSITTNAETLSEKEKNAACSWLGAARITADDSGVLTVCLPDGSKYKVNATKEET